MRGRDHDPLLALELDDKATAVPDPQDTARDNQRAAAAIASSLWYAVEWSWTPSYGVPDKSRGATETASRGAHFVSRNVAKK
jgi:hypothetical protein